MYKYIGDAGFRDWDKASFGSAALPQKQLVCRGGGEESFLTPAVNGCIEASYGEGNICTTAANVLTTTLSEAHFQS